MFLNELTNLKLEIINNVEFDQLGMTTTVYENEKILSFLGDIKYLSSVIENPNIVAIVTTREIFNEGLIPEGYGIIIAEDPKLTFYKIHNTLASTNFYREKFDNKISESAVINSNANIADCNVEIGDNCIIESEVVVYPNTKIGNDVIIRAGSIIGSEGFQFLNDEMRVVSVKSAGGVIIENNVEIQNNTCVDRGVFGGNTLIKQDAKIDNLIHIAHDVVIGKRTMVVAGSAIGGRTVIGDDAWIGINATISNGLTIGDNCRISLGAVVTQSVPAGQTVTGNFAIDHKKFIEFIKSIR